MAKLLIVDDDEQMLALLSDWFQHEQYVVETVNGGKDALFRLRTFSYDAVILDWEMPEVSGVEVCKVYRSEGGHTPILMLTGKDQIADKLQGLDTGADDYLCKPCNLDELSARLRAILRRPKAVQSQVLKFGNLEIDVNAKSVIVNGKPANLQPREFELLTFLAQHSGEVFNAEALMNRIWPSESEASPDVIRVHVAKLRSKLAMPDVIKTVHGAGYRFDG
jgi:DNA-binding response OmpR family regulator